MSTVIAPVLAMTDEQRAALGGHVGLSTTSEA